MLWFALSYGVAILGYLGLYAAAGRWLGPPDFGYFVVVLTLTGLVAQVGLVGSHRSGLREAARLREAAPDESLATLRVGLRAVSLTTLPATALLAGVVAALLGGERPLTERVLLGVVVALLVHLTGQQKLWANYLRGFGHVRFASLLEGRSGGALVGLSQAALVVLAAALVPRWGLPAALSAAAAGYVVPILAARRTVHRRWRDLPIRPRLWHDLRTTVKRDWRFASVQVATHLNAHVEIWIAAIVLSSVETSMFSAGQRLAMLLVLPMTSLQVVFSPAISRLAHGDDPVRLERLLRTGATLALLVTLAIWVPMVVAPGAILGAVFGGAFEAATPALLLLSTGYLVNVLMGLAGLTLSMAGHEGVAAKVQWVGVALRPLVAVPAALLGGVVGLAVGAATLSALVFIVMWLQTRRVLGVSTHVTLRPDLSLLRRTAG